MRIRVVHDFTAPRNAVEYAFETLLPGEAVCFQASKHTADWQDRRDGADLNIEYIRGDDLSAPATNTVAILASSFFGPDYGTDRVLPTVPLDSIAYPGVGLVPVLFHGPRIRCDQGSTIVEESEGSKTLLMENRRERWVVTNLDIIAGAFFMLSRYEEVYGGARDQHARFASTSSVLNTQGLFDEPVVDQYREMLCDWIQRVEAVPWSRPNVLPQGKKALVCMTHDVDRIWKWKPGDLRKRVRTYLQRVRNIRSPRDCVRETVAFASDLRSMLSGNPYWSFPQLLDCETAHGLKPCFLFMATEADRSGNGPDYSLSMGEVAALIQQLGQAGCEIGLHGSYGSFGNSEMLMSEKSELEGLLRRPVKGVRQHYLRFKAPHTWEDQEKAGFRYDSTVGFADLEGFRAGTCHPFRVFDVLQDRRLDLWELPITVMDRSLHKYRSYDAEEAYQRVLRLLQLVQRYGGAMVIIWHNSFLADLHDRSWEAFYGRMIDLIASEQVLSVTPNQAIDFWEKAALRAEARCASLGQDRTDQPPHRDLPTDSVRST